MYKLSPSDFAYLYQDCKHCFYRKIKDGILLPSMPFPGVFSAINTRLQGNLVGKKLQTLSEDLPDGVVVKQEEFVESIVAPDTSVYIKGKYDLLVENQDKTYTLIDLKISQPNEEKIQKYKMQLAAYKFALHNPKHGRPINVTRLGLLIFYPSGVSFEDGVARLDFPAKWLEVPVEEDHFLKFLKEVDELLAGPLPKETHYCKWCQYRRNTKLLNG